MSTYKRFEEIEVWQKARELAQKVYRLSTEGSFAKDFKLRDQMNGSAGSIMDNIAEGFERDGKKEFIQFLSIAKGSADELRSQLYCAHDRDHISKEAFDTSQEEVIQLSKQISGFMHYLKASEYRGTKYINE